MQRTSKRGNGGGGHEMLRDLIPNNSENHGNACGAEGKKEKGLRKGELERAFV